MDLPVGNQSEPHIAFLKLEIKLRLAKETLEDVRDIVSCGDLESIRLAVFDLVDHTLEEISE